ncbi:hypothetical protein GCM10011351_06930 [Paraliobacillus quinghaiensis]|uniref:Uncharacterized protein n=1 Tax=Paraliobacillus quinghaiensis TaxID=470815 RepID=A0A917TK19_9BACI|nr:hypothetical protein [Paraliobacillus quinghaiensis]GGM23745.1 hypothetical protein GCM10011351_06930 [Paraliobacillus quinghaiensis]
MELDQALNKIIELIDTNDQGEISDLNKNHITLLLKQVYGTAYRKGMEEGNAVSMQLQAIKR